MLRRFKDKINGDLHLKELLKGSGISFILKIIGMGFGYIFTILLTRNYGAKITGIYTLSLVVLQVGTIIGQFGMDTAVLRFAAEYSSQNKKDMINEIYKKILKLIIPISLIISISVFFLSSYISHYFFHKNYLSNYFKIISIGIVPYVLFIINLDSLRGLKKIKEYAFLQNMGISFLTSVFLGLSLFIVKNDYIPVSIYVASILIMSLSSCFLWFKKFDHIPTSKHLFSNNKTNVISYKNILSVSAPILISSSLGFFISLIDITILGIFKTSAAVGIYSIVIKLSSIVILSLSAINTIAAPKFVEFWGKSDKEGLLKMARQATKIIFWTSFPIMLIIAIFPYSILGFFGSEFKAGALALIMLSFGQFVNAISGSVGYILEMTGFQFFTQNIMIASIIINIILNLLLIPKYSIDGAAFASMITLIFWNLAMSIKVKNILGGWVFYKPFYN